MGPLSDPCLTVSPDQMNAGTPQIFGKSVQQGTQGVIRAYSEVSREGFWERVTSEGAG